MAILIHLEYYEWVQCQGQFCFCVDPASGDEIDGTRKRSSIEKFSCTGKQIACGYLRNSTPATDGRL